MKKLLTAVVVLGLFGAAAFAQDAAKKNCLEDSHVINLQSFITLELDSFRSDLAKQSTFNPNVTLQYSSLFNLRKDYMELRELCPQAVIPELAKEIDKPVPAGWMGKDGKFVLTNYIEHFAGNIWYTEADKFREFADALEHDKDITNLKIEK